MAKLLEVIVTSPEEAREAELGGANRLELVRALEAGGLTPPGPVVEQVLEAVSIPVRVMLRENASMSLSDTGELERLQRRARELSRLPIEGLVLGFVKDGALDIETMGRVLDAAPQLRATLHRAFEHAADPLAAIRQMKQLPQIDRVLTSGGAGLWPERKARLLEWEAVAAPQIRILVGIGLRISILTEMAADSNGFEFHVGRAARIPHSTSGVVRREQIAQLKAQL
jgi:copper homeostasis protein